MFDKLEYIYAVYETGSFSRAAQKLFISQPSLSAAIQKEEKRLGAPLFERGRRGVTLTEIGREYIAAAKQVRMIDADLRRRIEDIYNVDTGHITVGGTNYLSSYILPEVINKFSMLHPKVEVTLTENNSLKLAEMVENETVDIIIDSSDENMETYCGFPMVEEHIFLCVPSDLEINNGLEKFQIRPEQIYTGEIDYNDVPAVDLKLFEKEKFVLLKPGNDMHRRAMQFFQHYRMQPNVLLSVDQMNISYALTRSGMGLCFATDTFFRFGRFHENVVLYNLEKKYSGRVLYVAHKKNRYCTRAIGEFIRIAKEEISARFVK